LPQYPQDFTNFDRSKRKYIPGLYYKEHDILALFKGFNASFTVSAAPYQKLSDQLATVVIDGVPIEKDFPELIAYLQTLSAKDVEYIEEIYQTPETPGGIINIVTSSQK